MRHADLQTNPFEMFQRKGKKKTPQRHATIKTKKPALDKVISKE